MFFFEKKLFFGCWCYDVMMMILDNDDDDNLNVIQYIMSVRTIILLKDFIRMTKSFLIIKGNSFFSLISNEKKTVKCIITSIIIIIISAFFQQRQQP